MELGESCSVESPICRPKSISGLQAPSNNQRSKLVLSMKPGEPLFDFYADVMETSLSRFGVSVGGKEVYPWLEGLFTEFQTTGAKRSSRWLRERLALEYKCVGEFPN